MKDLNEEQSPAIADYLAILKRRWPVFFVPATLITLVAAAFALFLPPVYQSSSTILIEEQELPLEFVQTTVTSFVEKRLQEISQKIMVTSRLREIIDEYGLYEDLKGRKTREEIIEEMRENIAIEPISTDVIDRRTGRTTAATIAFTVAYSGKNDPVKVHKVATKLTSLFLEENLKVRERQVNEASLFFEEEINKVKSSLLAIDAGIAGFKEGHINELPEILPINVQDIHRVDMGIERVEEQIGGIKERIGDLESQLAFASPQIADEKRLVELQLELDQIKSVYSEDYPDVIRRKTEINDIKQRLDSGSSDRAGKSDNPVFITLSSQLESAYSELATSKRMMEDYRKQREELQRRITATPGVEQKYRAIALERDNIKMKYDDLMQKYMEAKVAQGLEKEQKGERFTMIDPALLPEKPIKPNRLAIGLIGIIFGIGAGVALAAFMEFADDAVRDPEALKGATSVAVLSVIPPIRTDKERQAIRTRRTVLVAACLLLSVAVVAVFHFFVMDLDILWIKLAKKLI